MLQSMTLELHVYMIDRMQSHMHNLFQMLADAFRGCCDQCIACQRPASGAIPCERMASFIGAALFIGVFLSSILCCAGKCSGAEPNKQPGP